MPAWPASLPQNPLKAGFVEEGPDGLLFSEMDAGPAKARRRFTSGTRIFKMSVKVTKAQYDTLDLFFETTLVLGSVPFTWVHPITKSAETFRFRKKIIYRGVGETSPLFVAAMELEIIPS